jgi:replicative superfamily II helicase
MSTGAGKSGVGLVYLKSFMTETKRPAVYLCPTTQLVDQVVEEGFRLGIKAFHYAAGQQYPGAAAMSGQEVVVCTYNKLFNAKTTFDRDDVLLRPVAIVLDDAHAGIEEVRQAFTLRVDGGLHSSLLKALDTGCRAYMNAKWTNIIAGNQEEFFEVPYWIWKSVLDEVIKTLSPHMDEEPFCFVWGNLRDQLRWCRCIVSGTGTEVVPTIMPLGISGAYWNASHRLFMSGTLADDSVLVRELGCDPEAAKKPILSTGDKGIGERMVLVPSLVHKDLNRSWVMQMCKKLASRINVVVLCSSEKSARQWEAVGAKVVKGTDVGPCVKELREGKTRFVALAQRYDGIDLPDDACRVLVLDGMPLGQGITDKYDSMKQEVPGGIRNRLIYRIEQGMGRAVRSNADYAVVILAGLDLANFVGNREVVDRMNPATRAQVDLAIELANLAAQEVGAPPKNAVQDMIVKCLKRDEGWKQLYNDRVRSVAESYSVTVDEKHIHLASSEQHAAQAAFDGNAGKAVQLIEQAITSHASNEQEKGWLMQEEANYLLETDPGKSMEKQSFAHTKNKSTFRPPHGVVVRPPDPGKFESLSVVSEWFRSFANPNAAIAELQILRSRLSYEVNPKALEQAILELARPLGAIGSRPEEELSAGPDDLWLWPEASLVIEVQSDHESSLPKKDSGQLHDSLQWFKKNYPGRIGLPVVVAKVTSAEKDAHFPTGTRVLTPKTMASLLDSLDGFIGRLVEKSPLIQTAQEMLNWQSEFGLLPNQFVARYTVPLK